MLVSWYGNKCMTSFVVLWLWSARKRLFNNWHCRVFWFCRELCYWKVFESNWDFIRAMMLKIWLSFVFEIPLLHKNEKFFLIFKVSTKLKKVKFFRKTWEKLFFTFTKQFKNQLNFTEKTLNICHEFAWNSSFTFLSGSLGSFKCTQS